jgi:uncharacterized protein (DUF2141 family)
MKTTAASLLLGATCVVGGCTDADTFVPLPQFGGPAGVITGAVTYSGPPPCTGGGRIVGTAVLFAFEEALLPPPEGLGTQPVALQLVDSEKLFSGVRAQLGFDPGGKLVCPPSGADPIVVTAEFALSPLPAGTYQVRGFYDYDGDWDPLFAISNLPSKGDVGGGAIDNAADVLLGADPVFRSIPIGVPGSDGRLTMPETGVRVDGIAATLGLVLPFDRPIFHVAEVLDSSLDFGNDDPSAVTLPSDYPLEVFSAGNPTQTEASFVRLVLAAGLDPDEAAVGAASPFFLPNQGNVLVYSRQDVDGDGDRDGDDHIPETALVPALLPLGLLTRLADGSSLESQRPAVILQGVTLLDSLLGTVAAPADLNEPRDSVLLGLRPAVLCIDPFDQSKDGVLVTTHATDEQGNELIADPEPVEAQLTQQFGRPVHIEVGCLPQGRYAMNVVYDTGQAWTVPNEAGICAPAEADLGTACGTRPKLASQSIVVTVGEPTDPGYCVDHPTPAACTPIP